MTLTGESENKLEEVRSKVSDVNSINDIKEFINDSLLETFSTPDFFVNNTVRDKLKVTVDSIKNCAKLSYDKINTLITEYNGGATAARKSAIERAIKDIEKTVTGSLVNYTGPNLAFNAGASRGQMDRKFKKKYNHYNELYKSAKKFIYTPDTVNCTHELGENTKLSEKLNKIFVSGGNAKYYIVGDDGNRIKPIGGKNGKYKFKMKMVGNPPEQEVEVSGIKIDGNSLILKDVSFEPSNIDMREPLTFNIAGSFHNVHGTGVNLVHMKKFEIKLSYNLLNEEKRRRQFDKYNNSLKERPIEKALEDTFTDRIRGKKYNHESERKALKEVLTNFDDRKYNDLTDAQKEKFFQRMFRGGWKNRTKGIIGSRKSPNFEEFYSAGNIRSYNTYKKWFVADDKAWNKDPKNAKSETNYMGFIKDNASSTDKCKEFVCDALKKEMLDKKSNYRLICARFTEFLDEIEENKTDNIKLTKQMHKNLGKKGLKMDEGPRSIFHPRDINYMRFFVGSSKSITDQEVKVYTNQGVRGVDNQSFKYGLDINVGGDHNINLKINTSDGKKFEMSAGEPSVLARRVLKNDTIWPSKARVHICFNIYKAMIAMAKDKNISLTYRDGKKLKEIYEKNGDIIIEEKINKGNTLSTKTIFSEKVFSGVNDFDRGGVDEDDIGVLNRGIEKLGEHFNKYMNLYHKNYRKATERRLGGLLHSPSRPALPTCFWLSPIKKILNCSKKTTTNFDFDAPIKTNIGGKDIEVDFKKNKFTITIDKKKYSSRDLGKLLNLRSGGDRIFEGIDRELSGEIYRKLIKELLRKNRKIARTSFGVKDSLTGNLYVLDKNGRFGYISQEDLKKSRGHVMKGIISRLKKSGYLKDKNLFGNDEINYNLIAEGSFEEKELLENPILMQKFLKVMNRRMAVIF